MHGIGRRHKNQNRKIKTLKAIGMNRWDLKSGIAT
jgi:hypothetical protein